MTHRRSQVTLCARCFMPIGETAYEGKAQAGHACNMKFGGLGFGVQGFRA